MTTDASDFFGLFGGGFDGAGVTTGGLDLGGVFFLSSFFCAETAMDKPTSTANVKNIFCKTLISLFFLLFVNFTFGREGKPNPQFL
jgi:hypothetical protein